MSLRERLGLKTEPIFLIDGHAFIYRGFYAYPDFKRADGFPTSALFLIFKLMLKLLREASERGVLIVNLSQCLRGKVNMGGYATGNALADAGVLSGFDMTTEAALAKLHFLLSQPLTSEQMRTLMQQDLRGELSH